MRPASFILLALMACSAAPKAQSGAARATAVTGTVTYVERIALPRGAVVTVQLLDLTGSAAQAAVIGEQTITTSGEGVPVPFSIAYDSSKIDPRMSYSLSARIDIDGKLSWLSTETQPVITLGNPTSREIVVTPVSSPAPAP